MFKVDSCKEKENVFLSVCVTFFFFKYTGHDSLGCPKKIKSLKCHAPQAFSGAEFHKDSENTIKNDLAQL